MWLYSSFMDRYVDVKVICLLIYILECRLCTFGSMYQCVTYVFGSILEQYVYESSCGCIVYLWIYVLM